MSNEMIDLINSIGLDKTAELVAEYLNQKILSEDVAMQFILEELEAASKGNLSAQLFAETSGFDKSDYEGSMSNSFEEVDGPNGPQQEILNLCMMLHSNEQLMVQFRVKIVDRIMQIWKLGKYSSFSSKETLISVVKLREDHDWGLFANIMNDLGEYAKEYAENDQQYNILRLMAYAYARRTAAAGLYLQGYLDRENYNHVSKFFKAIQQTTGFSREFQIEAAQQAIEYLLQYNPKLDNLMISQITTVVELNQVESPYDNGLYFTDEQVFEFFIEKKELKIIHDKYGNEYREIVSPFTGKIWLDRNLGAKNVATSYDDENGYGDYFQWGRDADGHQFIDSHSTSELSNNFLPKNNNFISSNEHNRFDWTITRNDNLWQGLNGINNPCPEGYRLPTFEEIAEETYLTGNVNNNTEAFDNFLHLPSSGIRTSDCGKVIHTQKFSCVWTSDVYEDNAMYFGFNDQNFIKGVTGRATGFPIRCIKE